MQEQLARISSNGTAPSTDPRASILVVEEDSAHAEAILRALEVLSDRYRVRCASSIREGRLALTVEPPILVLCDMNLSDGQPFDLLLAQSRPQFPLLVLTSHGDERMAVHSIRSGAIDYVVKSPKAFAEMPRTIERALREWRLIEERGRAIQGLRESEERFRVLFAAAPDASLIHDLNGRVLDANRACEALFELARSDLLARSTEDLGILGDEARARVARIERQRLGRSTGPELCHVLGRAGRRRDIELRTVPIQLQGQVVVLATMQDVSWRLEAEQARHRLEEELHHAMKMDAIGRLAGGVAHDFNNLLTAILGYTSLLMRREDPGSSWHSGLSEILNAAQRASGLTNQLLAFSRKQLIAPVVLDLNALLGRATRMVQRLIGEHIELSFEPAQELHYVQVDPSQMEQVLINLAINARDAMPHGGRLHVKTFNTTLLESKLPHIDAHAGEYVVWSVEDTGAGMSRETLEHLFEPFFTTKETGQGTGLGLSIVYGVVKQNGGFIVVHSEADRGSLFEIYLPRSHGALRPVGRTSRGEGREGREGPMGSETILLVEDEPAVREVAAQFLRNCGYKVVVATHGVEAVELVRDHNVAFDLLVTDVVLPAMNGRELFDHLREIRTGLRVVFMSGYTDDLIAQHGVLEPGVSFIEKPFNQESLARKVRETLDRGRGITAMS